MKTILYFIVAIMLVSCNITHNMPLNQTPNEFIKPNSYKIFVDQNGNFYPKDWELNYGKHPRNGAKYAYSLNTLAIRKEKSHELLNAENEIITKIQNLIKDKKRIFIIIHGYNNSEEEAKGNFTKIYNLIDSDKNDDFFLNFYWDGLVSNRVMGSIKIWFNAAGYSQLAGEYGLRKVLNSINNKEIIIISHSRGASVVLSSFSNPPYNEKFAEETKIHHQINTGNPIPLQNNNNIIKCILLAPAIGLIDFKNPEQYTYREISDQVKQIQITINNTDSKLKKYVPFFSDKFNPTNLGYTQDVFDKLVKIYPFLSYTNYSGMKSHKFSDYIENHNFKTLLRNYDIKIK